ncbi:hypothetical protein SDC9_19494 [bioreactor metagenome]|uniref:Uncharacterized protein n=1 Tax=bioreactor metagenome TaxID=1076179 RepID=A0A644U436_9ZZZZ
MTGTARSDAPGRGPCAGLPPPRSEARGLAQRAPVLQLLGNEEGEFQRLRGIQPRVAGGVVAARQILVRDRTHAAGAFGHVAAGHLEMHAARDRALGLVHAEELAHLAQHGIEGPGLEARRRLDRVAMHRVARPQHVRTFGLHRADQPRQMLADLAGAKARDQCQPSGFVLRVQLRHQHLQIVGRGRGTAFQPDRVLHAAAELDMRAVGLTGAVADPDHVARARQRNARGAVDTAQRLFVFQQQRLVRGVEIDLRELMRGVRGHPGRGHEVHRIADALGHLAIARGLVLVGEAGDPALHPVDVGIAAGREGAQQVQRGRGLGIGLQHPVGIGHAGLGGEVEAVDDVAAIARQLDAADRLGRGRARLGELPGHAPDLDHRHFRAPGQHDRHLQHHLEGVADVVGGEFGKALGAVAALQQERLTTRGLRQIRLQPARLAGEDERRHLGELRLDRAERSRVGIVGHLHPRFRAPAGLRPPLDHLLLQDFHRLRGYKAGVSENKPVFPQARAKMTVARTDVRTGSDAPLRGAAFPAFCA